MKLVKFKDGTYGIRRFSIVNLRYEYRSVTSGPDIWWPRDSMYFSDCRANENVVVPIFNALTDEGEPV